MIMFHETLKLRYSDKHNISHQNGCLQKVDMDYGENLLGELKGKLCWVVLPK